MRFVFAALMLVFLATSVHAQDDADDEEMLLLQSLIADEILRETGIKSEVVNVHTLKPISEKIIEKLNLFKNVITIEEHSIVGGLHSIIAEKIASNLSNISLLPIALPDKFGPTGTYKYLLEHHGLIGEKIALNILNFLNNKKLNKKD